MAQLEISTWSIGSHQTPSTFSSLASFTMYLETYGNIAQHLYTHFKILLSIQSMKILQLQLLMEDIS